MINKFLVEVKKHSVIIYHEDELSTVHYRAKIDGLDYAYQIIPNRMSFSKPSHDDWFLRGGNQVRYHANNQGQDVRWLKVTQEFICEAMQKQSRLELEKWLIMRK